MSTLFLSTEHPSLWKTRLIISSVDLEAETLAQEIIDSDFKNCTVLSIMHRLKHVASYHRVAVLENGSLLEYDEPSKLLDGATRFAELYNAGGN